MSPSWEDYKNVVITTHFGRLGSHRRWFDFSRIVLWKHSMKMTFRLSFYKKICKYSEMVNLETLFCTLNGEKVVAPAQTKIERKYSKPLHIFRSNECQWTENGNS